MRKSNDEVIEAVKQFILVDELGQKYKSKPTDFIRKRKLPIRLLVLFMLRKLYSSLALEISDFFKQVESNFSTLTKSAFTQARQKLSPLFFHDLLQTFNQAFYTDNEERVLRLKSMRILAVDGSTLDLPYSPELVAAYGTHSNHHVAAAYVKGRVSVLYDLLNHMVLDGVLQPFAEGEPAAAHKHLAHCQAGDLIVYDRSYASFEMVHAHQAKGLHVLMRMRPDFSHQLSAFARSQAQEEIILMKPGMNASFKDKAYDQDARIRVRLVKFSLADGQQVILLTTLLDKEHYPMDFLRQLYGLRWGIETRYDILKNVLVVEAFSGLTQKAVLQDFYISLFLMNMQALLAQELEKEIAQRYGHRKYQYRVNLALAIGHLKKNVVELMAQKNPGQILAHLKEKFLEHVEPIRPNRKYPRFKDKYRNRKKPILLKNRKNIL